MARIRTIKPEFWTDANIGEVSVPARLLFIACWNFADDRGGLDRSAKQLKAQAFPHDVIDCEPLILELLRFRLLVEYAVCGKTYLHIRQFLKHQKIENPSKPRIPPYEEVANNTEPSPSPPPSYLGKGMEGKGREERTVTCPQRSMRTRECELEWFPKFMGVYPARAGSQGWPKARRAAHARVSEGHSPQAMLEGGQRYAQYCVATGKVGTEYTQLAATFLGPDKHFLESWDIPLSSAEVKRDANVQSSLTWLAEQEQKDATR